MARRVVVLGAVHADLVVRVARRPVPGETIGGARLEWHGGGKGANQAIAAARVGASVALVGRVGDDDAGRARHRALAEEGIDVTHLAVSLGLGTGTAVITLSADGENTIVVAPGADAAVGEDDVAAAAEVLAAATVLVAQLEVPLGAVAAAVERVAPDCLVVLNATPAELLPPALLARIDLLVVNESEAARLSGRAVDDLVTARAAAGALRASGARGVVVTLGAAGALFVAEGIDLHVPAPAAAIVDTTGAGDAFVGALAARLALGERPEDALPFAVAVGTATTEQLGATPVVPVELTRRPAPA